jgi:hypothetical protein
MAVELLREVTNLLKTIPEVDAETRRQVIEMIPSLVDKAVGGGSWKRAEHMQDLLQLMRELVSLVRFHEVAAAAQRLERAESQHAAYCYLARSALITEINRVLREAKQERDALREAVRALPERDRLFAEVQVEEVIDRMLGPEITRLRAQKRHMAKRN